MKVFCIDSQLTIPDSEKAQYFEKILKEQLNQYGAEVLLVNNFTINKYRLKVNKKDIIVMFNGNDHIENREVSQFMEQAQKMEAEIWPIGLTKDLRIPCNNLSKYQSYDIWEQLRSRDLGEEYLSVIAKIFSRKIIANVMPTLYSEEGVIFMSHRRLDGEEITANLCDRIILQSKESNVFRDVVKIEVGKEAQKEIDSVMKMSNIFIFIHTDQSANSKWVQKELTYAVLRNIPVLWVQIDGADSSKLSVLPSETPNLSYVSLDFEDSSKIVKIADEILQSAFEIIMNKSNKIFDYLCSLYELFDNTITQVSNTNMIYSVSVPRKGYHYPQRNIEQCFQLFSRTIHENDIIELKRLVHNKSEYDSTVMLTDNVVISEKRDNLTIDSLENFYYNWKTYLKGEKELKGMEIVICGAFPDGDEIYKQSLYDALVIFSKAILEEGYILTFGSHPTFQKLFFEIAKEKFPSKAKQVLKMYISKWFEEKYLNDKRKFLENAYLIEVNKEESLNKSLTVMRNEMIQRTEVAAIVCLGGKIKDNKAEEGIREEIEIAKSYGIPVFIVGSVGGCSAQMAVEIKEEGWNTINGASSELNEKFMESIDYFNLSQGMLSYLNRINKLN